MLLKILPVNKQFYTYYKSKVKFYNDDCGYDLYILEDIIIKPGETVFIDLGIKCEMLDDNLKNISYYLYPRSSISKTPLILANHVGIIDAGYRGNLKAAVKYVPTSEDLYNLVINKNFDKSYVIKKGTRLFQICSPTLKEFHVEVTDKLSKTLRGENGFGSTGK